MAAAAEPLLITVEEYRRLREREDVSLELHWGQVVTAERPKMIHVKLQCRLVELLTPRAQHLGIVAAEVPFRALPEYDLRGADVAFVSRGRWEAADDNDNLRGSPELVVEVLRLASRETQVGRPVPQRTQVGRPVPRVAEACRSFLQDAESLRHSSTIRGFHVLA